METLQINKSNALTAYDKGSQPEKNLLENLFGKQTFSRKITDRIKTMDDVYEAQGITESDFFDSISDADLEEDVIAYMQAKMITKVLNEGTVMNLADTNQVKYYPWFKINPDSSKKSGFGLSYFDFDFSRTITSRGARLAFKSAELAIYAGQTFTEVYERLFA